MGTSKDFGGPSNKTPLVPSWLEDEAGEEEDNSKTTSSKEKVTPNDNRFTVARTNFTKYVKNFNKSSSSNGLYKSCKAYVNSSLGGSKRAAQRMGTSRIVANNLVSLFSEIKATGLNKILDSYNVKDYLNRPIKDTLAKLIDMTCLKDLDVGNPDQGVARQAAIETVKEIFEEVNDIQSFNNFIKDEETINIILETFIAKSIKEKLISDIGGKLISNTQDPEIVENHLDGFIKLQVKKALKKTLGDTNIIDNVQITETIKSIYGQSYKFLEKVGE